MQQKCNLCRHVVIITKFHKTLNPNHNHNHNHNHNTPIIPTVTLHNKAKLLSTIVKMAFLLVIVSKALSPASNSAHDQFTIKTSVKQLSFLSTPQIAFSNPFKAVLHLEHQFAI